MEEPLEEARILFSNKVDPVRVAEVLKGVDVAYDLEHVEWLRTLCTLSDADGVVKLQEEALRLLNSWAIKLQSFVSKDGTPVPDPLRDELIDSAVTFLEDEQIVNRSLEEKIEFLLGKGLNSTEISIALVQVGLDPPASLQFSDPMREDMVENGAAFLKMTELKSKTFQQKLAFLKSKGLTNPEIIRSCEVAEMDQIPTVQELNALPQYKSREPREDMIKNGADFLKHPSVARKTVKERLQFLKSKGMISEEIEQACQRAGIELTADLRKEFVPPVVPPTDQPPPASPTATETPPPPQPQEQAPSPTPVKEQSEEQATLRSDMVKKGVTFLTHPSVKNKSIQVKLDFLRGKDLTEPELRESCKQAGIEHQYQEKQTSTSSSATNSSNVQKAVSFLKHPSSRTRPMRDKVQFLKSKGLTMDEIKQAMSEVGIEPNNVSASISMNLVSSDGNDSQTNMGSSDTDDTDSTTSSSSTLSMDDLRKEALEEEAEALASHKLVAQAKAFLLNKKTVDTPNTEKIAFLLARGLSLSQVKDAFEQTGLGWNEKEYSEVKPKQDVDENQDLFEKAKRFLTNEKTQSLENREKAKFLFDQGIGEEIIKLAFEAVGIHYSGFSVEEENEKKKQKLILAGKTFIERSRNANKTVEERISFLKNKGMSDEDIQKSFELAGTSIEQEQELEKQPIDKLLQQAISFLDNPTTLSMSRADKEKFLQERGLNSEQIKKAFSAATTPEEPISPKVQQAVNFLLNAKSKTYTVAERKDFLTNKGLSSDDIAQAFKLAGVSHTKQQQQPKMDQNDREDLIKQAANFLTNKQTLSIPAEQRLQFLRDKGLSETEIKTAVSRVQDILKDSPQVKASLDDAMIRQDYVDRGAAFLTDPAVGHIPLEDKVEYLQSTVGLTEEEILQAAIKGKVDLVPSHLSTISMRTLKEKRLEVDQQELDKDGKPRLRDANGKALQRVMNSTVDLLLLIEKLYGRDTTIKPPAVLTTRSITLLGTSLCRCIPGRVAPASVAFSCRVLSKALQKIQLPAASSPFSPSIKDLELMFHSLLELTARSHEIDYYAKDGLNQLQQINLHFLTSVEVLSGVFGLWREEAKFVIPFKQGVLLSRAAHGAFCIAAAYQPYKECTGPIVEFVQKELNQFPSASPAATLPHNGTGSSDSKFPYFTPSPVPPSNSVSNTPMIYSTKSAAAYVASGLLRGGPDYAWGTNVPSSPQPGLEAALHSAAKSAVLSHEAKVQGFRQQQPQSINAEDVEEVRVAGMVVSVGLACVYADNQISWGTSVLQVVIESLLQGVLYHEEVLGNKRGVLLEERAREANSFVKEEIFQLAPKLVSLILDKLEKEKAKKKKDEPGQEHIRLLCQWIIFRLNVFSLHIYMKSRSSTALASVIARRTVQLVYGTGKEDEHVAEEQSPARELQGEDDDGARAEQDSDSDDDDDDEEEEDDDDEEKNSDEGKKNGAVDPVEPEDPLKQYLGPHSGLARILQMGFLSVVMIGQSSLLSLLSCCTDQPTTLTTPCFMLWDSLANLNFCQVRVQDLVDLEQLLKVLTKMGFGYSDNDTGNQSISVSLFSFLFQKHIKFEDKAVMGEKGEYRFDWVYGGRLEYLLSSWEEVLLPVFVMYSANQKSPVVGDDLSSYLGDDEEDGLLLLEEEGDLFRKDGQIISAEKVLLAEEALKQASKHKKRKKRKKISAPGPPGVVVSAQIQLLVAGLCTVLVEGGVYHPFVHLNVRVHRWMTEMIANVQDVGGSDEEVVHLPLRLACVPKYIESSVEAHPEGTPTKILAFVVGSVLTSFARDPDERAQTLSVMAYHRLALAVDDRMAARPTYKKDGPQLSTLLFTALKAISPTVLPLGLDTVADIIKRSPRCENDDDDDAENEESEGDLQSLKPLTHEWFVENLFGVISRTNDTPRRTQLAMWYLETVQKLCVGGKL